MFAAIEYMQLQLSIMRAYLPCYEYSRKGHQTGSHTQLHSLLAANKQNVGYNTFCASLVVLAILISKIIKKDIVLNYNYDIMEIHVYPISA
jgi:hypothetical protein